MSRLAIIIPVREGGDPTITLASLARSEFQDFTITVQPDRWGNANAARNAGFRAAPDSEYLLFSDDDVDWRPDAIGRMVRMLEVAPGAAFAYGAYRMGEKLYCQTPWSDQGIRQRNLASTMSVIRRSKFPADGWDESLKRLQDWDLWLRMSAAGEYGIHCGGLRSTVEMFETAVRQGITYGSISWEEAIGALRKKHGI